VSSLIRAMAAEDLDGVLVLAADSEAPRWTRSDYERILHAEPSDPLQRCALVALASGNLAGFAVATWLQQEPSAELEGVFVDRDYRRQGIGGALVAACQAWAASTGATTVRLEVRASNAAALALYRMHGFSTTGIRPAYYSVPLEDAVLLEAPVPL
jgi:[ribosomal protein S18]-alanine N-acetyltransferase